MRVGLFQGCPISAAAFVSMQLPLLEEIKARWPSLHVYIYADDITFAAEELSQLQAALDLAITYYDSIDVMINARKTQFWVSDGHPAQVKIKGQTINSAMQITILGMTFHSDTLATDATRATRVITAIKNASNLIKQLPMSSHCKENLMAAVVMAKWTFCPWNWILDRMKEAGARAVVLAGIKPYMAQGPRSATVLIAVATKAHRLDPWIAPIWSLIRLLNRGGVASMKLLQECQALNCAPNGPHSVLAKHMTDLGAKINEGVFVDYQHQPISILAPKGKTEKSRWQHDWRAIFKDALVIRRNAHRREFGAKEAIRIDFHKSVTLLRRLEDPKQRALLEVVISGGMLTAARRHARDDKISADCPICGGGPDTEIHRFWDCAGVQDLRDALGNIPNKLWPVTRLTGLSPILEQTTSNEIRILHTFMIKVLARHDQKFRDQLKALTSTDLERESPEIGEDGCDQKGPQSALKGADPAGERGASSASCGVAPGGSASGNGGSGDGCGAELLFSSLRHDDGRQDKDMRSARHKAKAGDMRPQRRITSRTKPLPVHIQMLTREIVGHTQVRILRCQHCMGVARDSDRNRFIARHGSCTEDKNQGSRARRRQVTQAEARALSATMQVPYSEAFKKRKRAMAEACTIVAP